MLKFLTSAIFLSLYFFVLNHQWGTVPPLMKILDPFRGLWVNGDRFESYRDLEMKGVIETVTVHFDEFGIPHIFAKNENDLYFAQGFLTARDRLWQMDIQSRVAEGTLSEIFGERTIDSDRFFIRSGLRNAALASFEKMKEDPTTLLALEAYGRGVNAYIAQLTYRDYPAEYKILDVKPRRWKPENSAFLLKMMDYTLTAKSSDVKMSRNLTKFPYDRLLEIFPLHPYLSTPSVYTENSSPKAKAQPQKPFGIDIKELKLFVEPEKGNGSNNWAVGKTKSTTGAPIIANDTHLTYRLPNIWYEVQLHMSQSNTYGVSLPGAPGIILGFNNDVGWAVTNATADTFDLYRIRFTDESRREYLVDNEKMAVEEISYVINVRNQAPLEEKYLVTQFGPIVYEQGQKPFFDQVVEGFALKWQAQVPSNEVSVFLKLNRARNYNECKASLEDYSSPSQNFICADKKGSLGLFHAGYFPVKREGQGVYIEDGSNSRSLWKEYLSLEEIPKNENPREEFLFSANQNPVPKSYSQFFGTEYYDNFRARRIRELLMERKKFSPDDIIQMQNDRVSILPGMLLPYLIKNLATTSEKCLPMIKALRDWKFSYEYTSIGASLFYSWFSELEKSLWLKTLGDNKNFDWPLSETSMYLLMHEPQSKWFDNLDTAEIETARHHIQKSFEVGCESLISRYGTDIQNWKWHRVRPSEFPHIAKIPGFNRKGTLEGGDRFAIFASKANHGPVYKAVIALGDPPQAWMGMPGGVSGNPFSRRYDNLIDPWSRGEMKKVKYFLAESELPGKNKLRILPAKED